MSVIVPVRDGARTIAGTLGAIRDHLRDRPPGAWELLVVDDGSADATGRHVIEFARAMPNILLLRNPGRLGCGYAVRHGVQVSRGERILLIGPDLPAPCERIEALERALDSGHDIALLSRRTGVARPYPPLFIRKEVPRRCLTAPLRWLGRRERPFLLLFQLYRRSAATEIFERQRMDGPSFGVEALYLARRYRYSVLEVGIGGDGANGGARPSRSDLPARTRELLRIRFNRLRGDYG